MIFQDVHAVRIDLTLQFTKLNLPSSSDLQSYQVPGCNLQAEQWRNINKSVWIEGLWLHTTGLFHIWYHHVTWTCMNSPSTCWKLALLISSKNILHNIFCPCVHSKERPVVLYCCSGVDPTCLCPITWPLTLWFKEQWCFGSGMISWMMQPRSSQKSLLPWLQIVLLHMIKKQNFMLLKADF